MEIVQLPQQSSTRDQESTTDFLFQEGFLNSTVPAKPVPLDQNVIAALLSKKVHIARHEASPRPPCRALKTTPKSCSDRRLLKATVVYAQPIRMAISHMRAV
jgi:hypothetical protein